MNDQQLLRYSRHILLDEIDLIGQQKLLNATVLVVGCGGLGVAALPYLAAAGIGKLIIADDDVIDESNLQRQICYREANIGQSKAQVMGNYLNQLNSTCQIEIITQRLDQTVLSSILPRCDVVLDCCDNFATRQAINAAAVMARKPLVSGAAVRFDGQLAVYRADQQNQPCYACLFDVKEANDGACALFGVFSPLVGIIGTHQAAEALKLLLDLPTQSGVLRCYNALSGQWQAFQFTQNPHCQVCGQLSSNTLC